MMDHLQSQSFRPVFYVMPHPGERVHVGWFAQVACHVETVCPNCDSNLAAEVIAESYPLGGDLPWRDFCQCIEQVKVAVDDAEQGMIKLGIVVQRLGFFLQRLYCYTDRDTPVLAWLMFFGDSAHTLNTNDVYKWIECAENIRDQISARGWPLDSVPYGETVIPDVFRNQEWEDQEL